MDEAVNRRDEFDSSLDGFLEALADVEKTCNETESQPMRVQERVEIVRVRWLAITSNTLYMCTM